MSKLSSAQICKNGHAITDCTYLTEYTKDFCDRCGEPTLSKCENCNGDIPGRVITSHHLVKARPFEDVLPFPVPKFCRFCGKSYPWTQKRLNAAKELADELDELNEEDREKLKGSLEDLVQDGPRTELAATRIKKLAAKLGTASLNLVQRVITDIASESAKKIFFH